MIATNRWQRPRAASRAALVLALALGAGLAIGCDTGSPDSRPSPTAANTEGDATRVTALAEPSPLLDEGLMLRLSLAKNHHHKADVYLREMKVTDAITELDEILTIDFDGAPEGEDVHTDARARIATLLIGQGQLDRAMTMVEDGIAQATRESFFVANLYAVRGEVWEARAVLVEERDADLATAARRNAISSFDRAIAIERALLAKLSPAPGAPAPSPNPPTPKESAP